MATKPAGSKTLLHTIQLWLPLVALAWVVFLTVSFVSSAHAAAEGSVYEDLLPRDNATVGMVSIAVTVVLGAQVLGLLPGRLGAIVLAAAFVGGSLALAILSTQVVGLLFFLGLVLWCWSVGAAILRLLHVSTALTGHVAHLALAIGMGLGALNFVVLALALLRLVNDTTLTALIVAGLVLVPLNLRPMLSKLSLRAAWRALKDDGQLEFGELAALTGMAGFAFVTLAVCLTPQTGFDALHYHLAMPKYVIEAGRFVERPDIIQSYFPLGLEMTFVPALRFGGEATANLMHWLYLPLSAAIAWTAGDRLFGRPAGAIGAALFVLMPLVFWTSPTATGDLSQTFFLLAAMYLLAVRLTSGREIAFAVGLFAGLSLAFKVVAAIYVTPVTLVFALSLILPRFNARPSLSKSQAASPFVCTGNAGTIDVGTMAASFAKFAAGGLVTGAPWLVVRYLQVGNPVLPLFNNVFKSDRWAPVNERFDLEQFGIGTSAHDLISIWWDASTLQAPFGQSIPQWYPGLTFLLPLGLLVLLPVVLWSRRRNAMTHHALDEGRSLDEPAVVGRGIAIVCWLVAAFACFLVWFVYSQYTRYALPVLAMFAVTGGWVVAEALRWVQVRALRSVATAVFVAALAAAAGMAGLATMTLTPGHFPTDVLLGRESEADYRRDWIPNRNAIDFFDGATRGTNESGALLGFPYNYFASNYLYDTIVPPTLSPFRRIVESGVSDEEMARQLVEADVRWFVYDSNNPFQLPVWPHEWLADTVLSPAFIQNYTETAFSQNGVIVYHISDPVTP